MVKHAVYGLRDTILIKEKKKNAIKNMWEIQVKATLGSFNLGMSKFHGP